MDACGENPGGSGLRRGCLRAGPGRGAPAFILRAAVLACFLTDLFSLESEFMLSMLLFMSAFAMTFL